MTAGCDPAGLIQAANVIVMGSPAMVVREITPDDDIHYDHGKAIADNIVTLDALQQCE